MSNYIDGAQVEIVTVDYFGELGYEYIHGPVIVPDGDASGRGRQGQALNVNLRSPVRSPGRVAPGDCSPGAPTDPYVQDYRIRFLK